jgi:ABC transport system ATP-binding/permease protein
MDKLVDHLFVLEGNGKIRDYNHTYSEYRELKKAEEREKQETKTQDGQAASEELSKGKSIL